MAIVKSAPRRAQRKAASTSRSGKAAPTARAAAPPSSPPSDPAEEDDEMSPEAVEAARGKLFVEYPLFVPPPIANANLDALRKRYESVGVPIGPEASEVLLEGTDAEIAALLTPEQRYVRERGWTPLEFLHAVYKQPFCPLNARLRAAEKLMEYLHRPLPRAFVGVEGQPGLLGSAHDLVPIGGLGQFDPKRLSAAELTSLDALMRKGCGEAQPVSNAIKGKK